MIDVKCPLCDQILMITDKPMRTVPAGEQEPRDCECGVEAWIMIDKDDGLPFVAVFNANREIFVTKVKDLDL